MGLSWNRAREVQGTDEDQVPCWMTLHTILQPASKAATTSNSSLVTDPQQCPWGGGGPSSGQADLDENTEPSEDFLNKLSAQ